MMRAGIMPDITCRVVSRGYTKVFPIPSKIFGWICVEAFEVTTRLSTNSNN